MRLADSVKLYASGDGIGLGTGGANISSVPRHGHPEEFVPVRSKQRKGGPDKGGVVFGAEEARSLLAKLRTVKKRLTATSSGSQAEQSSLVKRPYAVVDPMNRVVNEFDTEEQAQRASEARRYARVVPVHDTPAVRDIARKEKMDKGDINNIMRRT